MDDGHVVVSGRIDVNLYQALDDSATILPKGARAELAWTLADIFEYRVDMSRELQPGDRFRVLVEREVGTERADEDRARARGAHDAVGRDDGDGALRRKRWARRVLRRDGAIDAGGVPARAARVPAHLERLRPPQASDPRRLAPAQGHGLRRERRNAGARDRRRRRHFAGQGGGYGNLHRDSPSQWVRDALRPSARASRRAYVRGAR